MQFTTLAITAFAALTSAAALKRAPIDLCPALDTPQCCQVDVDGVVDLTCEAPSDTDLTTVAAFEESCAASGTTAMCCTLPVAGLGVLCNAP